MISAGHFTSAYAKALLAATRQADLANASKPKKVAGMTADQRAREMESLTKTSRRWKPRTATTSCT